MKKLLDIMPQKNNEAFDILVQALKPDYNWLSVRLEQGLQEEQKRMNKMGKGENKQNSDLTMKMTTRGKRLNESEKVGVI